MMWTSWFRELVVHFDPEKKAGTVGKCDVTTAKIHDKSGFSVVRFEVLQVEHLKNIPKN